MNKKLTILDIADLVATKSGVTKKEAELFVKEFFSLASEIISSGESLTIKGVGAFVPVWVEARTSVDVNTKQPIEIPGHYKLSFTPDKTMKDAVNAPFAAFTTEVVEVEIPEMVEIKDVDNGYSEEPSEDVETLIIEDEGLSDINIEIAQPEIVETEVVEESKVSDSVSEDIDEEITKVLVTESQIETPSVLPATYVQNEEEIQKEYRRRTRNGYIFGFLTALILFVIFISLWFFIFKGEKGISLSFSSFKLSTMGEQVEEQSISNNMVDVQENNIDTLFVDPIESEELTTEPEVASSENKYPLIETIQRGKFLTTIAEKHYGNKAFWVYIYRENSGRIWNPRDLKAGFKVVVPAASKYGIDATNPESVAKAKELETQILYEIE